MRTIRTHEWKLIHNLAHQLPYPVSGDLRKSPSWMAVSAQQEPKLGEKPLREYQQRPEFELYDMKNDPDEMHNLANDPAHATTLANLQQRLEEWRRQSKDPWVTGDAVD